jgi:EmrB/QacA subfamily drug resistance transporter
MTTLDTSIVNIALPSIGRAFHTPLNGTIEWVIIAYLVVIAALLLPFGRLSDIVGRAPIWTAGLALFTLGSGVCGAAPSLGWLIAARCLQGIGGALILSTSTAILSDAFPPAERGRALGWGAVAIALGTSAGPTLGGLITEHLTWRWIFYANLPIGIGAIIATPRILPPTSRRGTGRLDPTGALLLGLGVALLNLALSFGESWGWGSRRVVGALAIGVGALVGAGFAERRVPAPLIDLRLFASRLFSSAVAGMTLSMLALFAVSFIMPFYFEELRGFSTVRSGWLLTPLPLAIAAVAPIAGRLADRLGSRWLSPLGLGITAVGLALLARLDATSSAWDVTWRLVVSGVGQGMFQSPNTRALMDAAPTAELGEASGILATARVTGQALSVAVAGAVLTGLGGAAAGSALLLGRGQLSGPARAALQATFLYGFRAALLVCAGFAAVGAAVALVRDRDS